MLSALEVVGVRRVAGGRGRGVLIRLSRVGRRRGRRRVGLLGRLLGLYRGRVDGVSRRRVSFGVDAGQRAGGRILHVLEIGLKQLEVGVQPI
jgi:hypothetical protein